MEKQNSIDAYGRTLSYVFLADGTCLNELMISEGHAKPYSKYYCEALKDFQIINTFVRNNRRGHYKTVSVF